MKTTSRFLRRTTCLAAAATIALSGASDVAWAQPSAEDEADIWVDWIWEYEANVRPDELGYSSEQLDLWADPEQLDFGSWTEVYYPKANFTGGWFTRAPFADDLRPSGWEWVSAVFRNGSAIGAAVATEFEGVWTSDWALGKGAGQQIDRAQPGDTVLHIPTEGSWWIVRGESVTPLEDQAQGTTLADIYAGNQSRNRPFHLLVAGGGVLVVGVGLLILKALATRMKRRGWAMRAR